MRKQFGGLDSQKTAKLEAINNKGKLEKHSIHKQVKMAIISALASLPNSLAIVIRSGPRTKMTALSLLSLNGGYKALSYSKSP